MFETPHYVAEIYQKKEDLRVLRENVLLVVRDYNRYVDVTMRSKQDSANKNLI
jgi:dynein heavy chain